MAAKKKSKSNPNKLIAIDDGDGRVFVFRVADKKAVLKDLCFTDPPVLDNDTDLDLLNITEAHHNNKYICIEYKANIRVK
jgi:hypothetical protein